MPIYEYRCNTCHEQKDIRFHTYPSQELAENQYSGTCDSKLERLISAPNVQTHKTTTKQSPLSQGIGGLLTTIQAHKCPLHDQGYHIDVTVQPLPEQRPNLN